MTINEIKAMHYAITHEFAKYNNPKYAFTSLTDEEDVVWITAMQGEDVVDYIYYTPSELEEIYHA